MTWTVVGVPIDCVGAADPSSPLFGTELAPAALLSAGLLDAVRGRDGGLLDVRVVGDTRDPSTGLVGGLTVAQTAGAVRETVAWMLTQGERPLLVGGCCTLLPGALAGVRDVHGPVGLVYVDGHLDLYDETTSPTGEGADMPCAVLLGHGPGSWLDALGPAPVVAPESLVITGYRDLDEARELGSLLPEDVRGLWAPDVHEVRADPTGVGAAGAARAARDDRSVWLHLDVDVLDEAAFGATDYLMPGGLSIDELSALLCAVTTTVQLVGASVACYNPSKDPEGRDGRRLVDLLGAALG